MSPAQQHESPAVRLLREAENTVAVIERAITADAREAELRRFVGVRAQLIAEHGAAKPLPWCEPARAQDPRPFAAILP